ncbi:hypothetical protein BB427_23150 [Pseudoalteromonas sp. BMB]|uniref:immunity protein YezG family protein n=1 Tax=Pseudoalteromonas sp. BMB TaxID=1874619 RepID=UPI00083E1D76|nr:immunity protein YezG family protein [Pseudoalteromonas sp. BMB]ODB43555.1 hypothetical protein BB427_23150 [Pseudoalteromonas sp. BMB]
MNDIYEGIASYLIQQARTGWVVIIAEVEFFEDSAEFDITCQYPDNTIEDLDSGFQLFMKFKELYRVTTENPENKWNKAKFILNQSGEFNIDFEWDQDLADEIKRLS